MKVGIAQTRPITADIRRNIEQHKTLIAQAAASGADILIFPELSLTGYEPSLAQTLAVYPDDKRLDTFQKISDAHRLIIGAGIPTQHGEDICISMVLFQPGKPRQLYSKQYLHADEEPFFVSGQHGHNRIGEDIALAICYEISVPQHAEKAFAGGAKIYIASVAKFMHGIDKALVRLAEISRNYSMTVMMSNSIGQADGYECAGRSSIWNNKGELLGQLDGFREGILILDTDTGEVIKTY
ncbi:MAG TPA: carbon-nitrogen hydrolase family protein [Puia sp.]|nr:carbon-nitrogen hydrolase family protein [Puia sp.]